ncbi:hypothetical protein EON83_27615 [bacterium]|nr:MAG: hypothetical protein EON83_27615 [bacterium]
MPVFYRRLFVARASQMPRLLLLGSLIGGAVPALGAPVDGLRSGFLAPPQSAKPQTWWHWMNGNISKAGITADLEAMKRIGLGGATIVNVDGGIPEGPVEFMSAQWREDFKFAVQEADRLGLKLTVANCAGWSSSGGPWNTPANGMQRLTSSETRVAGGTAFDAVLAQPQTTLNYYRDIAVLAFKAPATRPEPSLSSTPGKLEIKRASYQSPVATAAVDVTERLRDMIKRGQTSVGATSGDMGGDPAPGEVKELILDFVLDGKPGTLTIEEWGRLIFPTSEKQLAEARKQEKNPMNLTFVRPPAPTDARPKEAIPLDGVVDLTAKMGAEGRLRWDVPAGEWVVVRMGYTATGTENHPAPAAGRGLECDKMSKSALDTHWNGFMGKVLSDVGPLAGKALDSALIDSYEVGNQDWTPGFQLEFRKRRGYDPIKYLPTFTGQVVGSPETTERFLWDMRRTVADLFAENYYGHFAQLCRQNGLQNVTEPYFGPYESMQSGATADVVMGEFWAGSQGNPTIKLAASIAHSYGKSVVGAESFTATAEAGRWQNDPYSLKTLGDLMFSQGLNRYIFHRYAMQPWTNRAPGMTMGEYGFHFERTLTWWQQGKSWIDYIAHCQFLLQQGRAVADVAYFTGESSPVQMRIGKPALPAGYDYDAVNADVLLHGATVKNGRLTLASGASYAALVLPPADSNLTPPLLQKLRDLVLAGATVVGPRPLRSPSLTGFPNSDVRVKQLADEMWGKSDGVRVLENSCGKGRVVWGKSLANVFAAQKLKPDFQYNGASGETKLASIHRLAGEADIYFVSNQRQLFDAAECSFRVSGKIPELWHPESGVIEPAAMWSSANGLTKVRLDFEPAGSTFVIFRKPSGGTTAADHIVAGTSSIASVGFKQPQLVVQRAVYAASDGAGSADVTAKVAGMVKGNQLAVQVGSGVLGGDPARMHVKELRVDYTLDGVAGHASTRENGTLTIPAIASVGAPRQWEPIVAKNGAPAVKLWTNGNVQLRTAGGKTLRASAANVPAPQKVTGAWSLSFPPNWGAPPSVQLADLISWSDHTAPGVRYFSGTATYQKQITISAERLRAGRELWLDLGAVKNFAEVSLNGKALGVLWKPPFRVNVTQAAKAGANQLTVKVTNLWPNRLIGDEQLPPDAEWNGSALKAWPQWLLDGKPSPTGRLTFTTWRFWNKDSQLLPSGLLGPVKLETAQIIAAK